MKRSFSIQVFLCSLFLLALVFLTGCQTTEIENTSSRPWGYRGGYDPGLPSMFNEGR